MPQTVQQLLQEVFARLEKDYGQKLVGASLGLLSCVRNGKYEWLLVLLESCDKMNTTYLGTFFVLIT